jgi:hypothetical protein
MITPHARFFWPPLDKIDADSIIARNIYELHANSFIRIASKQLMMRDDISIGDRVEILASHLEYDPQIDCLVFEVVGFDIGGECVLELHSMEYVSEFGSKYD